MAALMEEKPENFANIFKKFLTTPVHKHLLKYSLLQLLGDLKNLSVLDVGCMEGYYSRLVKEMGAERVMGLGMSAELMQIAERHEEAAPLGIKYMKYGSFGSIRKFQFDIVMMMLSLNCSTCYTNMVGLCKDAYDNLTPGGRLVAIFAHRQPSPADNIDFENQYFTINYPGVSERVGETDMKVFFSDALKKEPAVRVASLFDKNRFALSLKGLGFREVEWRPCSVSPHSGYPEEFWKDIVESEVFNSLTCVK